MSSPATENQSQHIAGNDWFQISKLLTSLRHDLSSLNVSIPSQITTTINEIDSVVQRHNDHSPLSPTTTTITSTPIDDSVQLQKDLIELETETMDSWIVAAASEAGLSIDSPGRKLHENLHKLKETINNNKQFIDLSIGDPAHYASTLPNAKYLVPNEIVIESIETVIKNGEYNGYGPSAGHVVAREALLRKYQTLNVPNMSIHDIFITSGCTDALNIAISSVANPNDIILLPQPGIGRFTTICKRFGIIPKYYRLIIDDKDPGGGRIDLEHLEKVLSELGAKNRYNKGFEGRVKGVVVNNPSNPAGSVFSVDNLNGVLSICEKYEIPVISDEIYDHVVFGEREFVSMGKLTTRVPVLMCGGISKTYLVPGYRMGWLILYDPKNIGINIKTSISNLMTANPSQNTLVQAIIPSLFKYVPQTYYSGLNKVLLSNSLLFYNSFQNIDQLSPVRPNGAMYIATKLEINKFNNKYITNDIDFMYKLLEEQSVFVFCGSIFGLPNYFRTLILPPVNVINEVVRRIEIFCNKYSVDNAKNLEKMEATIVSKM